VGGLGRSHAFCAPDKLCYAGKVEGEFPLNEQSALVVNVSHDTEDGIWYVLSSDIPGLNAEAESLDMLVAVIADVAPDLIAANMPG
jgi:Domain of unknown function (DUF1902)